MKTDEKNSFDETEVNTVSTKKESPLLLVSALACLSLAFIVFKGGNFGEAKKTKYWPKTTGVITQSYIETKRTRTRHTYYQVKVSYEYQLGSRTYKGKNILKNEDYLSFEYKSTADQALSEFPVGKTISVYYSPGNPQDSLLKPGLTWHHYIRLILWIVPAGVGLYILFLYLSSLSTVTTFNKKKRHY